MKAGFHKKREREGGVSRSDASDRLNEFVVKGKMNHPIFRW